MYCTHCGMPIEDGSVFCTYCGQKQDSSAPVRKIPWHSRGAFSPSLPGGKQLRTNVLLVIGLLVFQFLFVTRFFTVMMPEPGNFLIPQLIGFLPTAVLIIYIFALDTIEREPVGLLLKLFLLEAVAGCLGAALAEDFLFSSFDSFLAQETILTELVKAMLFVALVEEFFKYLILHLFTWKHKAFNHRFDGVVYAAMTALGFAALENVLYIAENGINVAISRAITAIPCHCVAGILMGIFYGQAKAYQRQGSRSKAVAFRILALVAPTASHGIYDYLAFIGSGWFFPFFMVLNAVVFVVVWRQAQKDEAIAANEPPAIVHPVCDLEQQINEALAEKQG